MTRYPKTPAPDERICRKRRGLGALFILGLGLGSGCERAEEALPAHLETGDEDAWLVCAEPAVDFGEVWEGAILEHDFLLDVRSPEELTIVNVRADCGCTVWQLDLLGADGETLGLYAPGTPLAPGSRLGLRLRYDTRGKEGGVPREIKLYCNQPSGVSVLQIQADVKPWLVFEPESAQSMQMTVAEEREAEWMVSSTTGERFRLRHKEKALPAEASVALEPLRPDDEMRASEWRVEVVFGRGMPLGNHRYPIYLETDVENPDVVPEPDGSRLPFAATPWIGLRVTGLVALEPPLVNYGRMGADEVVARTVRVVGYDPEHSLGAPRVRLEPWESSGEADGGDPGDFALARRANLSTRQVGENVWEVEVLLDGLDSAVGQSFSARLVVETGHPQEPRLEARLVGLRGGSGQGPGGGPERNVGAPDSARDPGEEDSR